MIAKKLKGTALRAGIVLTLAGAAAAQAPAGPPDTVIVSGELEHHRASNDLFHIGELWLHVTPDTEFHRWLLQGTDGHVAVVLTADPDRFADDKSVRILRGTLMHNTAPTGDPVVHEIFLRDPLTGSLGAVTFQTTDRVTAMKFDPYDFEEVNLLIQIQIK